MQVYAVACEPMLGGTGENLSEEHWMKRNFLITTAAAALLAGTMFAAAQGQGQSQGQGGARIQGQGEAQGQIDKSQDKGKTQRSQKKEAPPQTQGQGGSQAQGQRDDGKAPKQGPKKDAQPQTQGQGSGQGQTQGQRDDGKAPKQSQTQPKSGGGGGGSVTLSTEQRTKIRTTVLQGSNAPRVTNVNFSIRVGTVVPRDRVRLVTVSPILVEIHPEWRGFVYFIVDDQIIIVEPRSYKIVAVLEV